MNGFDSVTLLPIGSNQTRVGGVVITDEVSVMEPVSQGRGAAVHLEGHPEHTFSEPGNGGR